MDGSRRVHLDGTWDFQIDLDTTQDAAPAGEWRSALVPMPWQAQFADLRHRSGTGWYRRGFVVGPASIQSRAESAAILSAYSHWKGPGHNGILVEDGVYWMVYHAYDAQQIGIPKLRIESIGGMPKAGRSSPARCSSRSVFLTCAQACYNLGSQRKQFYACVPGGFAVCTQQKTTTRRKRDVRPSETR